MTTAEKTLRIRVTTEHEAEIDRRAALHGLKRSPYVRMAALNYPAPANAAPTAQRGAVTTNVPEASGVQAASTNEAPTRSARIAQRTEELRAAGVSTYAARDQAAEEIRQEDRDE